MLKKDISVVVPCYNACLYLSETLDSLLSQTYMPSEIIVVDDGSEDGSLSIADSYCFPVRVIRQANKGAGAARLAGAVSAKSELIAFNDADDPAPEKKLEMLYKALSEYPNCVVAMGVTVDMVKGVPFLREWCKGKLNGQLTVIENPILKLIESSWPLVEAMNLMTYRDIVVECGRMRPFYRAANDYDLQIRLSQYGPFVHISEITCNYRPHLAGISGTSGVARQMGYSLCAAEDVYNALQSKKKYMYAWQKRVEDCWARIAVGLIVLKDWKFLVRILRIALKNIAWNRLPIQFWYSLDKGMEEKAQIHRLLLMVGRLGRLIRFKIFK